MKSILITLSLLAVLGGGPLRGSVNREFEPIFEQYLRLDIQLDKAQRDEMIRAWPGTRSIDGVALLVNVILDDEGGRRGVAFRLLEHSEVPRQEVVAYLLKSCTASQRDLQRLTWHFGILDHFPEDARIVRYLGGMLDDKRVVPDKPVNDPNPDPVQEHFGGMPVRLCDCAYGTIGRILIARKDLPKQGLGVGDPGGEYTYEGRDRKIAALKKKLKELGLVDEAAPPVPGSKPNGNGQAQPAPAAQASPTAAGQAASGPASARALPWGWIAAAGLVAAVILTGFTFRRKG